MSGRTQVNSPNYIIYEGSVKVWDPRQKDEPVANMEPGAGQDRRDCWCVAFGMVMFFTTFLLLLQILSQYPSLKADFHSVQFNKCSNFCNHFFKCVYKFH